MSVGTVVIRTSLVAAVCATTFGASVVLTNYLTRAPEKSRPDAFYANCAAMLAVGAAPIAMGQPGYRTALDSDQDGVACEAD